MKNEIRNERSDPVVLARKRKSTSAIASSPKVRAVVKRGIVNWEPPAIDGEDSHSSKAHIAWMQKERKKKTCNAPLVEKKMHLTFSFRRPPFPKGYKRKVPISFSEGTGIYGFLFTNMQLNNPFLLLEFVF